ncbi:EAL domain-containing protein [Paraglaciecola sp. 2405UD69-4]|uniref:bifunctional diguanylate cyclase/phosphodiesterase n=1 Tax=Paraglaciecola sp. 2405UD69-4 TaxID=3391836 RepID=UPI0039C906AF
MSCIALSISIYENKRISIDSLSSELRLAAAFMEQELTQVDANSFRAQQNGSKVFSSLDKFANITYAAFYDAKWELKTSFVKDGLDFNAVDPFDYKNASQSVPIGVPQFINHNMLIVTVITEGVFLNHHIVVVSDSAKVLNTNTRNLLLQALPIMMILVIFFVAFGFSIQGKLLQPLALLARFAKRVESKKEPSIEIDTLDKRELVELNESLNSMLQTLNSECNKSRELTKALKEQQKNTEKFANFDRLTGFPNRQFFMELLRIELLKVMRNNQDTVLVSFELEGIKGVYHACGQEAGDQLLAKVCKRVKSLLREGDIIARLDEANFLILLNSQPTDAMLHNIVERLTKDFCKPFTVNKKGLEVTVSIGTAKASDSNYNLSELTKNADIAMYRSKVLGTNIHTMFTPNMMKDSKRNLLIAASIEDAIANEEFRLSYQSRISKEEVLVGYDLSVHWNSKTLGVVPESEFMLVANQNGKSSVINEWVLATVCQDLPLIQQFSDPNLVVSITLSAANFKSSHFVDSVSKTLAYYQINPANIEFKLSELEYLYHYQSACEFLKKLKEIGVGIGLDNVGHGYSALGYLCNLELNTIRIDKQLIDNLLLSKRSTLVVKTIVKAAKQLGIQVCADGVETREQVEFLAATGCDQMEGFLFSKPANLAQLAYDAA